MRLLSKLVAAALEFGETFVFDGRPPDDWPQPVRTALERYLRENPSRLLIVKPLFDPARSAGAPNRPAEAALVVEVVQGDDPDAALPLRLELVARHGGRALFQYLQNVLFVVMLNKLYDEGLPADFFDDK